MAVPTDVEEFVEKHIKLMISQTETYLPFIKVAFPYSNNMADGVYNLIIGSALSVFVNQYATTNEISNCRRFYRILEKLQLNTEMKLISFFK